ncbi:MAG TPA: hotdog domain-containing protein [Alphaproteobacteria bacterium]|nr:hotdog domain-containing protein [Alphaproteobacteria bacterium]
MITLMENAALNALKPYLTTGNTAVGTRIDVRHLAATPLGRTVMAKAIVTEVEGRRIAFSVEAHDGDRLIGEGRHERRLIDLDGLSKS